MPKSLLLTLVSALMTALTVCADAAEPLRVFIRGGQKTHGPGAHEHEQFLKDWQVLLRERGAQVEGGMDLPTDEQLARTDVIVMYAQEGGTVPPSRWAAFDEYLKRGGGLVVLHTAVVSTQPDHWKTVIGATWRPDRAKWREGPMDLYYAESQRMVGDQHPITRGASNFHLDDEIYYDLDYSPDIRVLATSYTPNVIGGKKAAEGGKPHIYDIQPQMWVYERAVEGAARPYRAFVSVPGHLYKTFSLPHYRAVVLRGIAWAGWRENLDEFCTPEELASLTYPEGGPQRPEDTLKNLEIHPDFTMTLVAAEPLINKPMNFDWDPQGRLWVAETPEYPNGRRGMRPDYRGREWKDRGGIDPTPGRQDRPALDKISILSDTDGDGVMDKKDVFFEGLDLVTGLVFYKDGVIVTQAPDILFLRDTDGDGKADKVEKLYTNLGTGDTHAVINNPRMGWDGWIYATHGYSASRDVRSGDGSKSFGGIGSGVVRFKPDGSAIEQYSSKGGNTWGLTVTADNRIMWTQPTSGTILEHTVLPEYALARGKVGNTASFNVVIGSPKSWPLMTWEQMAYVQIDLVGSFTATAGTVIYDGGSWPEEYNGDYFTTEPTINIIHHERLTPKGSSYVGNKLPGREETEFVRSGDMWWRPIEVRTGPDGAMYVADFYNQAVIHNDTRGPDHNNVNAAVRPDRDHYFGRIWRVDHKQAKELKVPALKKDGVSDLIIALNHPARHVRMNASRLLVERFQEDPANAGSAKAEVEKLLSAANPETQIAALWTLTTGGVLEAPVLEGALKSQHPAVRRNAANAAEELLIAAKTAEPSAALVALAGDEDPQVRVNALRALGSGVVSDETAKAIIAAWPKLDDDWQRSAAVGAAMKNPSGSIAAALDSADPAPLAPLVKELASGVADHNDAEAAAKLVVSLAGKPASTDALKAEILNILGRELKKAPTLTPELSAALSALLDSGVSQSALTLVSKWDTDGALRPKVAELAENLKKALADGARPEQERLAAAKSLVGLRAADPEALSAVTKALENAGAELQKGLVTALGEADDAGIGAVLAGLYASLAPDVQQLVFETLLKRGDWSMALLDAIQEKKVDPSAFGPARIFRIRTHPDKKVAERAAGMEDVLNPGAKAKTEAIAKLLRDVEKPGDVVQGKLLFNATCGVCHKFGNEGTEIGPNLTGMGSHGPGELLTAIVDPNREVEPSYTTWNIETHDGQFYAGIIVRENQSTVTLKSLAGQQEVKVADIKSRQNTGFSLMPEGFEELGPEVLRNIIAYMIAESGGGRFRTLDLSEAFTTTTARGLYISQDRPEDSIVFAKTGTVQSHGVPFNIVAPERAVKGNVVVLKGGAPGSYSRTLPRRVEVKVGGFKANRLHFLGGIAGWGSKEPREGRPVLKTIVRYSDGDTEEIIARDGVEFADYIGKFDVPGSKPAYDLVRFHPQLRFYTKTLKRAAPIDSVVLESYDNHIAPTTVAITAELAGENAEAAPEPKSAANGWGQGPKVLLAGGGSSHDFWTFFNQKDSEILKASGFAPRYTEDAAEAVKLLAEADVLLMSTNQGTFANPPFRKALEDFAAAGKGIVLLHAGVWYNFPGWPEFNKIYVGGGSRGHDRVGEFEVKVSTPDHPVLAGVPGTFKITDELYYMNRDPEAAKIEVLASATSPLSGREFPSVWVVEHPKTRVVGLALGHDGRAHDLPAFQKLLVNAVKWVQPKEGKDS